MILRCLEELESKLVELREAVEKLLDATEAPQMVRFMDKDELRPRIAQSFKEMGIRGQPIGAVKVQEMIAACGVQLEENTFSRGIIEMREE